MIRLHAVVEGQTEEAFFNRVLVPHLSNFGVFADVQLLTSKTVNMSRSMKGGWTSYDVAKRHLRRWMSSDCHEDVWYTTMVDLYAIPIDFPKLDDANEIADPQQRVIFLEQVFRDNVITDECWRFKPYLQLHEFEALVLADPQKLDWEFIEHDPEIAELVELASKFSTPELIDDDPESAPSKRIIAKIPEYKSVKASAGPLVADKIGLTILRERCPHFNAWIKSLEDLAASPAP